MKELLRIIIEFLRSIFGNNETEEEKQKTLEKQKFKFTIQSRKSLLTNGELAFRKELEKAIPPNTVLVIKPRMEDVLQIKNTDYKERQRQRNHIRSRHFDFVIADSQTLKPLAALELDDKSHRTSEKAKMSDAVKNAACNAATFPLVRILAASQYNALEIEKTINENIQTA